MRNLREFQTSTRAHVLILRAVESSEVLSEGGGPAPWAVKRRTVTDRVRTPQGNTHSVGSESRQGLRINRLVSHRIIDEHPRSRCRSVGEGGLPKLGYKVEVVSDLAQSSSESPVVELVPADSVRQRHVTEAQLLAGKRRLHLRSEMCRFRKISTLAAKANYLRVT